MYFEIFPPQFCNNHSHTVFYKPNLTNRKKKMETKHVYKFEGKQLRRSSMKIKGEKGNNLWYNKQFDLKMILNFAFWTFISLAIFLSRDR